MKANILRLQKKEELSKSALENDMAAKAVFQSSDNPYGDKKKDVGLRISNLSGGSRSGSQESLECEL